MKRLVYVVPLIHSQSPASLTRWSRTWVCALVISALLSATSSADVQAASCVNLIIDSGLENGAGWVTKSSGNYPILSSRLTHTGKQAAYLAGANNAQDLLATTVKLPASPQSITITFWWQVQSQESGRYQDMLTVGLADAQGKSLHSLASLSSRDMSNQWQQRTLTLNNVASQTLQLQFSAQTDAEAATDFFIDDVEFVACS